MKQKPLSCRGCPLEFLGESFSNPEGYASNGVLLVGEALGRNEALDGLPFRPYAESGALLERAFSQTSVTREQFGLYNVVGCRPPDNKLAGEPYELGAINHCSQHLKQVFNHYKPQVIVTLGAVATRALTGLSGDRLGLDMIRGFALPPADPIAYPNCVVVPTYHPAFITRGNFPLLIVLQRDMNFARSAAKYIREHGSLPQHDARNYKLHATSLDLRQLYSWLKNNPSRHLFFDFESVSPTGDFDEIFNYRQDITQINFGIGKGTVMVADWVPSTKGIVQDILAMTSNPKSGHNIYHFDIPLARWNGFDVRGDRLDDTLWAFHSVFSDLPGSKGGSTSKRGSSQDDDGALAPLQFCASMYGFPLPWKHLFKLDPHLYGAYDADAPAYVLEGCFRDLKRLGAFEGYELYTRELRYALDSMERRGIPCNQEGLIRLSKRLGERLAAAKKSIQTIVPEDVKELLPKAGYKTIPATLFRALEKVVVQTLGGLEDDAESLVADALKIDSGWVKTEAQKLGYKIGRFELYNQPCSCLEEYYADQAQEGCKLCAADGGQGEPTGLLRGAAKAAKCSCTKAKSSCEQCQGLGQYVKHLKKCDESLRAEGQFWVAGKGFQSVCLACGKAYQACKACSKPVPDCSFCSGTGKVKVYSEKPCKCRKRLKPREDCKDCRGTGLFTGSVHRWARIADFNFNSPKQVLKYAQMKGHKIPMNSKRKIAMDKETIGKLAKSTGDPLYVAGVEIRELTKIKSAYADSWVKRGTEGGDFRGLNLLGESSQTLHDAIRAAGLTTVHTEFSYKPASTQLSSRNPNTQVSPNQSKYGQLATEFRENIEAPPGYVLLEADYKSFHVLTLGYEAGCPDYIRLARLDAHSYLAANMLQLEGCRSCLALNDQELLSYLTYVKKNFETVRNKQAKPGILGYGFGMGAQKLYELNPESFKSLDEAKWVIDMLNAIFPKVAAYRNEAPELAHRQGYLRSAVGTVRWFMNVKYKDFETGMWKHGKDWEKAIAFRPAANAFGVIKDAMNRMQKNGMAERCGLINNIHDALLFCLPAALVEQAASEIKTEMERPNDKIRHPDGSPFWCETEIKVGQNWASMMDFDKWHLKARG